LKSSEIEQLLNNDKIEKMFRDIQKNPGLYLEYESDPDFRDVLKTLKLHLFP
jgi:hypothetical protein